jgi:hypothetical protein
MVIDNHSLNSTLRENIVEHVFVGDALREFWRLGIVDVEVLHSEFDAHGYDIVMARQSVVRHIQFKTGKQAKPGKVSVSRSLALKPSGCVIWIHITDRLDLGPFYFFGGEPGEPLPDLSGYGHTKRIRRDKVGTRPPRTNHKDIPANQFRLHRDLRSLLVALFGTLPSIEDEEASQ